MCASPGDPCRDCHEKIEVWTKTSLRGGRCKPCHNVWFKQYIEESARQGKLTGRRSRRNKLDFTRLLAWPAPQAPRP